MRTGPPYVFTAGLLPGEAPTPATDFMLEHGLHVRAPTNLECFVQSTTPAPPSTNGAKLRDSGGKQILTLVLEPNLQASELREPFAGNSADMLSPTNAFPSAFVAFISRSTMESTPLTMVCKPDASSPVNQWQIKFEHPLPPDDMERALKTRILVEIHPCRLKPGAIPQSTFRHFKMEDVAIVERDYLLARLVWVPLTRRQLLLLGVIKSEPAVGLTPPPTAEMTTIRFLRRCVHLLASQLTAAQRVAFVSAMRKDDDLVSMLSPEQLNRIAAASIAPDAKPVQSPVLSSSPRAQKENASVMVSSPLQKGKRKATGDGTSDPLSPRSTNNSPRAPRIASLHELTMATVASSSSSQAQPLSPPPAKAKGMRGRGRGRGKRVAQTSRTGRGGLMDKFIEGGGTPARTGATATRQRSPMTDSAVPGARRKSMRVAGSAATTQAGFYAETSPHFGKDEHNQPGGRKQVASGAGESPGSAERQAKRRRA